MMNGNFIEVNFNVGAAQEFLSDLLMNELAAIGFDSFDANETGFSAYIPAHLYQEEIMQEQLAGYAADFEFSHTMQVIPYQNWNEVWESNFPPVIVSEQVYIYANFHPAQPQYPFQIKMHPKMAFGTGHHETTLQMAEQLLGLSVEGLSVLDMGCGTGVLAILASLKGAKSILAIDNDPIASNSATENFEINEVIGEVICGDAKDIQGLSFDLILANINRNILINDMAAYAASLVAGGTILFSGFYEEDLVFIQEAATENGLSYQMHSAKNNWVVAKFNKAI
jgi:ribosomal protein L11 methyltransferase